MINIVHMAAMAPSGNTGPEKASPVRCLRDLPGFVDKGDF
jgi:hypothetical protein